MQHQLIPPADAKHAHEECNDRFPERLYSAPGKSGLHLFQPILCAAIKSLTHWKLRLGARLANPMHCVLEHSSASLCQCYHRLHFGLDDVHNSDLLGLHAFSYSLVAYLAILWHRRIVALTVLSQALHLLPIFLLVSLFPLLAHWLLSGELYWWALTGAIQALIEAMLWPLATRILLAPQRRPIDVDHNRPL